MFKSILAIIILTLLISFNSKADYVNSSNIFSIALDLDNLCKQVYDLYHTDEIPAKKEILVYKKLNELIGTSQSIKITTTDSIAYDRKLDMTNIKSKEVYYADAQTGYFGIFVIVTKKGDDLLMNSSPDKEMNASGKITDVIVVGYIKDNKNQKTYTSLKDFDDKGTIIQQIILKLEM